MANTFLTYLLWLPFGIFGLHHIYLGRYEQAIAYGQTLGLFGMGYILDFFYIPQYVHDINLRTKQDKPDDSNGKDEGTVRDVHIKSCSGLIHWGFFAVLRFGVTFLLSYIYALMTEAIWIYGSEDSRFIENFSDKVFAYICIAIAAAYGARLIGNIGHSYSSYRVAFGGALLGLFLELMIGGPDSEGIPTTVSSSCGAAVAIFFTRRILSKPLPRISTRRSPPLCCLCNRKGDNRCCSTFSTILVFWLCIPLILILRIDLPINKEGFVDRRGLSNMKLGNYVYNHPGQSWKEVSTFWSELWEELERYKAQRGWDGMKNDFYEMWSDDGGYEVLGLDKNTATISDVKRAYREKAKLWHPDRLPRDATSRERDVATDRFRRIEKAYSQICKSLGGKKGCHGRGGNNDSSDDDTRGTEDESFSNNGRSRGGSSSNNNRRNRRNSGKDDL